MQETIISFRANATRIRATLDLYSALRAQLTHAVDLSDILRVVLVLTVSGLDRFIHDLVRAGMIEVWAKRRPATPAFSRFQISLEAADTLANGMDRSAWLESVVRERHGYLSFQQPDRIQDALRLFSSSDVWQAIGSRIGVGAGHVKQRLKLLVDRRNKIVHEADLDPSYPSSRWPIDEVLVSEAIEFISVVCETIHDVVVIP